MARDCLRLVWRIMSSLSVGMNWWILSLDYLFARSKSVLDSTTTWHWYDIPVNCVFGSISQDLKMTLTTSGSHCQITSSWRFIPSSLRYSPSGVPFPATGGFSPRAISSFGTRDCLGLPWGTVWDVVELGLGTASCLTQTMSSCGCYLIYMYVFCKPIGINSCYSLFKSRNEVVRLFRWREAIIAKERCLMLDDGRSVQVICSGSMNVGLWIFSLQFVCWKYYQSPTSFPRCFLPSLQGYGYETRADTAALTAVAVLLLWMAFWIFYVYSIQHTYYKHSNIVCILWCLNKSIPSEQWRPLL